MPAEDIIEELRLQNPWWSEKNVKQPENTIEREIFLTLIDELERKPIIGIIGLRRIGKTTLLKTIIKHLISKIEPNRICYFSFDMGEKFEPLKIVKVYSEEILRESLSELTSRVYFFFDEIQKVKNWGNQIKSLYDKEFNIKFIVSGSSSMNLEKGAGESLVGRILIEKLRPFTFREFLRYRGNEIPQIALDNIFYPENASKYRIAFKEYMERGGLPEMYDEFSQAYLRQMLDLTFFRDIVELFMVKRSDVLKGIFRLIAENTGQKINLNNISGALNTDYRTVRSYIQYLEDSFLIQRSLPYEKSHLKSLRKNPKIYVSDHSYTSLWNCKEGLKAQTIAFNHLKLNEDPLYYNKPEIDILLPGKKRAFEVKYSGKVTKIDVKNLMKLDGDFNLYLVTKDTYEQWSINGRRVIVLPLWLLCLLKY